MMRRSLLTALAVVLGALGALRCWPGAPLSAAAPTSRAVYAARGELLRLTLADDGQFRLWTPLRQLAPELVQATLLHEDRFFYFHPGVNPVALLRGAATLFGAGRHIGGSTLSMQLARRLWHIDSRRPSGKLRQIAAALWLELRHGKAEILEAYLNLVPYGGNVEGAGAASLVYFRKPAARLSLPEVLTLAVIPQSPARRGAGLRRNEHSNAALLAARARLVSRWKAAYPQTSGELMFVPDDARELPFLAPHFVADLLAADSGTRELRTTLDLGAQRLLERQLQSYVRNAARVNIHNASAMLLDTRSMEVKALVGSADFFDVGIDGQVNGATAKRSPGSTLKPFVYALGLEQGIIHPLSILRDVPTSFSAYTPENFDGRFIGPVSARDALIRSRNIPALSLSARLAHPNLYEFLRDAGVSQLADEAHYGLGLALGGAEVTMEELVGLYAMLGNGGVLRPLRVRSSDPRVPGVRVLSEQSAFLVLDMLASNPRPDRSANAAALDQRLAIAWKTGTSWGFRDAWTLGLVGPYVLAVWIGNFSGDSNPALIGLQAAAPLFFRIADGLVAREPSLANFQRHAPRGLARVEFCAVSGQLPGPHCKERRKDWFIPGRSPIETCQVHREIEVDTTTGLQVCDAATDSPRPTRPTRREVHEFWSTELLEQFAAAGLPRRAVPGAGHGCEDRQEAPGLPPQIISPKRGMTYNVRAGKADQAIALAADTDADARQVYWYVDRSFIGSARAGTPLFWKPQPGSYQLRAVDDRGRSDVRALRVELAP
jgi:penicillin-binding protein 1C